MNKSQRKALRKQRREQNEAGRRENSTITSSVGYKELVESIGEIEEAETMTIPDFRTPQKPTLRQRLKWFFFLGDD
jgi:hypothetical protein